MNNMMKFLKNIFRGATNKAKYDFSSFFLHTDPKIKMRVLEEAAKKANEDQRALIERHKKLIEGRV